MAEVLRGLSALEASYVKQLYSVISVDDKSRDLMLWEINELSDASRSCEDVLLIFSHTPWGSPGMLIPTKRVFILIDKTDSLVGSMPPLQAWN